ncbi:hypothetical protein RGU12_00505 [Fredinandcohnia sp. QZ13]|uniref:hypothetical protein n=1 Tax=Fredinandcohnia sp. QZ13 TaxID=3073144 RepID=UPI0028530C93|nr:hypothetical protein [Fredinandcohnia sp. QZ13]MDR4886024.1 hypothetical protein [Fredinandcohnia sp. QZ13]
MSKHGTTIKKFKIWRRQFISFFSLFDYKYRLYNTIPKTETPFGDEYFNSIHDEWKATRKHWLGNDVKPILIDDAHELTLPLGHPQPNILYVAHPLYEGVYYPAANFHPNKLETKYYELINLLTSLGAKEIKVEYIKGIKKDTSFNADANLNVFSAGAGVNTSKSNSTNIVYNATLEGKEPTLPQELYWFNKEISWRQNTT